MLTVVNKIEISFKLYKLVCFLKHIVNIKFSVNYAVFEFRNNHFTFSIKFISSDLDCSAVREGLSFYKLGTEIKFGVSCNFIAVVYKVEVSFKLYKLISSLTYTVDIKVTIIYTIEEGCNTIFIAGIIYEIGGSLEAMSNYANLKITLSVEEIGFSIDLDRGAGSGVVGGISVIFRTIPAADTCIGGFPDGFGYTAAFEFIFDMAVGGLLAFIAGIIGFAEIIPVVTDLNPTGHKSAGGIVIIFAVCFYEFKFGANIAAMANEFIAFNCIFVFNCFGNSTPIHNRFADFAVSSAGIAGFSAGSCFVFNCNGGMYVCGTFFCFIGSIHTCGRRIDFGVYAEFFIGECAENRGGISVNIGDFTHINVNFKVIRPEFVSIPIGFRGVSINFDIGIIIDYTDRERSDGCFAGLAVVTGSGNNDGCGIVFFINGIFSGEACCKFHMIKFEMVAIVEVDNGFYGFDGFDIGCIYIHPINGTAVKFIESGVCGNNFNSGSVNAGSYFNKSDNNSFVAHVIADFEFNTVYAVCDSDIGNIDSAVSIGCVNFDSVNISFCGSSIESGCVGFCGVFRNACSNSNEIIGYFLSFIFFKCNGRVTGCEFNFAENRCFSVINCVGEVCGDVININSLETVDGSVSLPGIVCIGMREHKFDETEVVCIVFGGVISDYLFAVKSGDEYFRISTYINGEIFPAGFIPGVINFGLVDNRDSILSFEFSIIVGIYPIKNTDPAVFIFIGNISPEADGFSVFDNYTLIKEEVGLAIAAGRNSVCGNGVHFNSHGTDTVMYFAVFCGCIGKVLIETFVVSVNVSDVPGFDIGCFFEVEKNFGTFAEAKLCSCGKAGSFKSCCYGTREIFGSIFLRYGSEFESIESTESGVIGGESYAFGVDNNSVYTIIDSCNKTDGYFFIKRNGHDFLCKIKCGGNYDFNGIFADYRAVINKLCGYGSDFSVGFEYTVFDGTHGRIRKLPGCICRNIRGSTYKVGTDCGKFNSAAGSIIIVRSGNACTNEFAGCGSSGDYEDTMSGGTFSTVGRRAVYFELFAGTLGKECGRTAAVTIYCNYTAEGKHEFSHLIAVETCRIGGLTTVVHNHYESTVFFNTYKGTGSRVAGMVCGVLVLAVFNKESEVCGDYLFFPTGNCGRGGTDFNFGHISGSCFAVFFIKVDNYYGLCTGSLTLAVYEKLAIKNKVTERFTDKFRMLDIICAVIPAEGKVHCRNNITIAICLSICCLLGHDFSSIVAGGGNHAFGAGNYLGVFVEDIDFNDMSYLAVAACGIVKNNFGLNNSGSKLIILFGNELIIAVASGFIIINRSEFFTCRINDRYVFCFGKNYSFFRNFFSFFDNGICFSFDQLKVYFFRKSSHRHYTDNHQKRKKH